VSLSVKVASRESALSKAQVKEVHEELKQFHPEVEFDCIYISTIGDRDLKTSLRTMNKTDFFTRDVDELLLNGECRIAIHSAKDLPDPMPVGLEVIALTKGVDPSDVLVLRIDDPLRIGSSSERRDAAVKKLFPHAICLDIRGTIQRRLELLDAGEYDAVVMAEAALIRLKLTNRKRMVLPCEPAPFQGRLAIVARDDDYEMKQLFSCINYETVQI
jgi:hydroxymethylbilane synthase